MPKDLLLEIGAEEMPSSAVYIGIEKLRTNAEQKFKENRLEYKKVQSFGTPRRLVLWVEALAYKQDETSREVKGPPKEVAYTSGGEPTAQAIGFAHAQKIKVDELVVRNTNKGEYVFAVKKEKGMSTNTLLPKLLLELVSSFNFPKSMWWEESNFYFVRPIRWILSLYGANVIDFSIAGVKSGNITWGHRILHNKPLSVTSPKNYFEVIKRGSVIVDHKKREELILRGVAGKAKETKGKPVIDELTLKEVVNLVEYPRVIWGTFSSSFLALPEEVLITAIESHQRYFPVKGSKNSLLPAFFVVHNGDKKSEKIIQKGHERVLKTRLADAEFFFKEDQNKPLARFVDKLEGVIFREQLGTLYDKTKRNKAIAKKIAQDLGVSEAVKKGVERAATLAKADLVTQIVTEFPDLQGVMGKVYASLSNESKAVADAIYEHYLPRYSGDTLPKTEAGQILSIADKIDSIVGCFLIGLIPTGSEDPYSLRRQAQGIINIILTAQFKLSLEPLLNLALRKYGRIKARKYTSKEVQQQVIDFLKSRLRAQLLNNGLGYDICDAVLEKPIDDILDLKNRAQAISSYRNQKEMDDLLTTFTRCKNLGEPKVGTKVKDSLLKEKEEQKLSREIDRAKEQVRRSLAKEDYDQAIKVLASLRTHVDRFFDKVLVMDEDKNVRNNRLAMLNQAVELFLEVADFSKIVVPG